MSFHAYVTTQFSRPILSFQTDNGREFDNTILRSFFSTKGIVFRLSCPYTSQQNGKAERILRTLNDSVRTLLLHASMPYHFWAEALATATYLLNRRPCKPKQLITPYELLYDSPPDYQHLRVFGCLCFPNMAATSPHKLAPRSAACVFLGYPPDHKGYRCYIPSTRRVIISRHVYFDEQCFPFAQQSGRQATAPVIPEDPACDALNSLARRTPNTFPVPCATGALRVRHPPAPVISEDPACDTLHSLPHSAPHVMPVPCATGAQCATSPPPSPSRPAHTNSPDGIPSIMSEQSSVPIHPMVTRSRDDIFQPNPRYAHVTIAPAPSPIPTSVRVALHDPHWKAAMQEEYDALVANETWRLVPRPHHANVVTGKWIFRHKTRADGTLERYKARWVVRGFSQRPGIDYDETFSPVVKPATIRTVLTLAASRGWPVHQLDVKNAFLHGVLDEQVFCLQPAGFIDKSRPDHVCLLSKSLYGLKQAPRAWFTRFANFARQIGFTSARSDASLFILRQGTATAFLLLYVDDIVLTASSDKFLRAVIDKLHAEFKMKDLGPLHYFLGIHVTRSPTGFFLSQHKYAEDLLERACMANCKPAGTPIDTKPKLAVDTGHRVTNPSEYRSLAGALQYLTMTQLDLAYAVQQVCLHMHDPRNCHLALIKRILRYVRGTTRFGLQLHASPSTTIYAYSDADWAGCPDTRRSTSGYCVYIGDSLVSWSSKRQPTVSRSSAEAEYRAVANAVAECCWLRQLLTELHCVITKATIVYCDNVSAVYMAANPVHHRRTKHIELDIHFVREKVALGQFRVLHVPTGQQFADVMTKGLPTATFNDFRSSLCIISGDDVKTAAGC